MNKILSGIYVALGAVVGFGVIVWQAFRRGEASAEAKAKAEKQRLESDLAAHKRASSAPKLTLAQRRKLGWLRGKKK